MIQQLVAYIKNNKTQIVFQIILAITVGLIFHYLENILTWSTTMLVEISEFFSKKYVHEIANYNPHEFDSLNARLLIVLYIISMIFLYILFEGKIEDIIERTSPLVEKAKMIIRESEAILNPVENTKDKITEKDLLSRAQENIEASKQLISKSESIYKKSNRHKTINRYFILITVVLVIMYLYEFGLAVLVAERNVEFQKDITIISAQISDQQVLELKVEWLKMKTLSDLESVNKKIENYKGLTTENIN